MYKVYLKKGEERRILGGHPWVYANEALKIEGKDKNGSVAAVFSADGRFVGKGFINHLSKILVRIMTYRDEEIDRSYILRRILDAKKYREELGYQNNYRAVFAESDMLPGLIVDKYGDYLSVQFLTLGMDENKEAIIDALKEVFSPLGIYERSDSAVRLKEGLQPFKGAIYGDFDPKVVIVENGVKMLVDLENGQKTGYYLDQKENRLAVRRYVKNRDVLDCFSNVGGFSINAAIGGAKSVTAVDISPLACDTVIKNAELNGINNVSAVSADVFEKLREYNNSGRKFGVVILDPPAFCKSASEINDAYRGYKDINIQGMKIVEEGGYLVTSSCTHYMTLALFDKMLKECAASLGRRVRVAELKIQSPDHASLVSEEESLYLKFFVLRMD